MASAGAGAAALEAAAVIAVVAVLLMSSQGHGHEHGHGYGHKKTAPIPCSNCSSLCSTNCSAVVAAECRVPCDQSPGPDCGRCSSEVLQGCQTCCGNTTSGASCCGNGCVDDCGACRCNCSSIVSSRCQFACRPVHSISECWACNSAVGSQCFSSCNSTCYQTCVNKGKGCGS